MASAEENPQLHSEIGGESAYERLMREDAEAGNMDADLEGKDLQGFIAEAQENAGLNESPFLHADNEDDESKESKGFITLEGDTASERRFIEALWGRVPKSVAGRYNAFRKARLAYQNALKKQKKAVFSDVRRRYASARDALLREAIREGIDTRYLRDTFFDREQIVIGRKDSGFNAFESIDPEIGGQVGIGEVSEEKIERDVSTQGLNSKNAKLRKEPKERSERPENKSNEAPFGAHPVSSARTPESPFGSLELHSLHGKGNTLTGEGIGLHSVHPDATYEEIAPLKKAENLEVGIESVAEKEPWSGTVDTIMVSLAGGNMEWAGHSYREYKKARNAYLQHLNTHRQLQGKEGKLDKESVRLREAYLEARNDLLFIIARRMRPGAGFVSHLTDSEAEKENRVRPVRFSSQDVLQTFEAADATITDTSFDSVKGLLHEPALVESYGQVALDSGYEGEVRPLLEGMLTTGIDAASFTGDTQALQTFSDARLEYLTALFRKSQNQYDERSQDFRRSWLRRQFSLFAFNKGRQGYLDRYQSAFHALSLTARDADMLAVRRIMQEVRNLIWESRIGIQKVGVVRPLTQELARHTRAVSHWLLALRDKFFTRPHDEDDIEAFTLSRPDGLDLWEPSTNGDVLTPENGLELSPTARAETGYGDTEHKQTVSFTVSSEDKGGSKVIQDMLTQPDVRDFLFKSFKLDENVSDSIDRIASLLFFKNLSSGAPAIFPQGTRLTYRSGLQQPNENGLFIQLGNGGLETRIIDENGRRTGYRSFTYEQ